MNESKKSMEARTGNPEVAGDNPAGQRVLADLNSLARDAKDLIKATASDLSSTANNARSQVYQTLQRVTSTCRQLQDETASKARAVTEKSAIAVRGHPYEAVGVAFGVGLIMGMLVVKLFSHNGQLNSCTQ